MGLVTADKLLENEEPRPDRTKKGEGASLREMMESKKSNQYYKYGIGDLFNSWMDLIIDLGTDGELSMKNKTRFNATYNAIKNSHIQHLKDEVNHARESENPYKMGYILTEQHEILRYAPVIIDNLKVMEGFINEDSEADEMLEAMSYCLEKYEMFPDPTRLEKIFRIHKETS